MEATHIFLNNIDKEVAIYRKASDKMSPNSLTAMFSFNIEGYYNMRENRY